MKVKRIDFKNEKGATMILVALMIVVLFGFTALVIDIGMAYAERIHLSNACDAAALAGGAELLDHPELVESVAIEYLDKNGIDINSDEIKEIVINSDKTSESWFVTVQVTKTVDHWFAPVIRIDSSDVVARARVEMGPLESVGKGIRPIAMTEDYFDSLVEGDLFEVIIRDKEDPGQFKFIDLDDEQGGGANDLVDWLLNGFVDQDGIYADLPAVDIPSEQGMNASGFKVLEDAFLDGTLDTEWFLPVVLDYDNKGMDVLMFASVSITNVEIITGGPGGKKLKIQGTFKSLVTAGTFGGGATGDGPIPHGVHLVRWVE